jgi:repressor LexA
MITTGEHYALEISGDSMINVGINDKDIAIIKKSNIANNGQIVVALVDKQEATLKKFKKTSSNIVLIPANDLYQSQTYESSRIEVQGILVGIMRQY